MARLGPDAARYLLAARGVPVPRPFHLRWLLPAVCGDDVKAWRAVWVASWPVAALGFVWWQEFTPQALAGAAFLLALPGILGPSVSIPVQTDLPALALGLVSCALINMGHPAQIAAGVGVATFAGCIRETSPASVALWAWSPWPLLGLLAPAVAALVCKPGPCPVGLQHISDHPMRASIDHHRGQWRDAWVMVAPWGVCLAALHGATWQVWAVLAVAYLHVIVATDTVRLYQHAAGPVMAATAAQVIPAQWLPLAVAVHVAWWRTPHRI